MPGSALGCGDEAQNANGLMRIGFTEDHHSHQVQPPHTTIRPHNPELTRAARGTIRPERFQGTGSKGPPVLRMDALQDKLKIGRRVTGDFEQFLQLVRPCSFTSIEVNIENPNLPLLLEFHVHLSFLQIVTRPITDRPSQVRIGYIEIVLLVLDFDFGFSASRFSAFLYS